MAVDDINVRSGRAEIPDVLRGHDRRKMAWIGLGTATTLFLAYGLAVSQGGSDVTAERLVNPSPPAVLPKLEWAGIGVDTWIPLFYGLTAVVIGGMVRAFIRHYRQNGRVHPGWPIFLALSIVGTFTDPIWNWAFYCNYNPDLLHWPVSWNLFNTAPTVEPWWIVLGAYPAFYLGPTMLAFWLHGRFIEKPAKEGSWVRQHPVASLFTFALFVGFVMDILMEIWMMNIGIYKYTQIAGPRLSIGDGHLQFIEIAWCGLWTAFLCLLLRRDDRGRSGSSRLATSVGVFKKLNFGQHRAAFAVITVFMLAYGGMFVGTRLAGWADPVPGDYPYQTLKTYDPDGKMQAVGQPGPFTKGTWAP